MIIRVWYVWYKIFFYLVLKMEWRESPKSKSALASCARSTFIAQISYKPFFPEERSNGTIFMRYCGGWNVVKGCQKHCSLHWQSMCLHAHTNYTMLHCSVIVRWALCRESSLDGWDRWVHMVVSKLQWAHSCKQIIEEKWHIVLIVEGY